jgi:HSP20 family protein
MAQFTFIPAADTPDIADDVRELFDEIAANLRQEERAYSGECQPALDVLETDHTVEVVMDVAGVSRSALRVLFRAGVLIIAGEKAPPAGGTDQAFHLVEREFGRFARAVRLTGAFDVANSRATLQNGELTIVLPKLTERRGRPQAIRIA